MRLKRKKIQALLGLYVFLGLLLSPALATDIFRCKDDAGNTTFQDVPCEGGDTPVISWSGSKSATQGLSSSSKTDLRSAAGLDRTSENIPVKNEAITQGKHFFWRTKTRDNGNIYLLGSIHFGKPEMYPLPSVITDAFQQSDALVVEMDALNVNQALMAQTFAAAGMYMGSGSLQEDLNSETWRRMNRIAASVGLSPEMMNLQKPWLASMTLGTLSIKRAGFHEDKGIDMHFLKQAQGKMPIIELEGMAYQAELMGTLPLDSQIVMLSDTLRILEEGEPYYQRMLNAWKNGKVAALEGLIQESF